MDTATLLTRTYDQLGIGGAVFWPSAEVVNNGLSPALRLLALLKPVLLTRRVTVTLAADQQTIDLRSVAPRLIHLQRVCLGDVTGDDPVRTQGQGGDLRRTSLAALRGHKGWLRERRVLPSHFLTHGLDLLLIWARPQQTVTLTLVYTAEPLPLDVAVPSGVPEIQATYHDDLIRMATSLLQAKEGAGEAEQAIQRLQEIIQAEPLRALQKSLAAAKYREQAMAGRGQAA